jgi:hypothetical protein
MPERDVTPIRVRAYEYRAVAKDTRDATPDAAPWRDTLSHAREDVEGYEDAEPPFDHIWIERRPVVAEPTPERVEVIR